MLCLSANVKYRNGYPTRHSRRTKPMNYQELMARINDASASLRSQADLTWAPMVQQIEVLHFSPSFLSRNR